MVLTGTDAQTVRPYTATWEDDGRHPTRHDRASLQVVTRQVVSGQVGIR